MTLFYLVLSLCISILASRLTVLDVGVQLEAEWVILMCTLGGGAGGLTPSSRSSKRASCDLSCRRWLAGGAAVAPEPLLPRGVLNDR